MSFSRLFRSLLSACPVGADLEEPWEHVGWLASDDKKARVELPKVGVQVLQTLEEKPGEGSQNGGKKGQQMYYSSHLSF